MYFGTIVFPNWQVRHCNPKLTCLFHTGSEDAKSPKHGITNLTKTMIGFFSHSKIIFVKFFYYFFKQAAFAEQYMQCSNWNFVQLLPTKLLKKKKTIIFYKFKIDSTENQYFPKVFWLRWFRIRCKILWWSKFSNVIIYCVENQYLVFGVAKSKFRVIYLNSSKPQVQSGRNLLLYVVWRKRADPIFVPTILWPTITSKNANWNSFLVMF